VPEGFFSLYLLRNNFVNSLLSTPQCSRERERKKKEKKREREREREAEQQSGPD
jgi:ribosomal protein L9